jgi:methyl-accepting chemotaxis protein
VAVPIKVGQAPRQIVPTSSKTAPAGAGDYRFEHRAEHGAAQVNNAVQQLSQVIQQNATASEEMATSSEELANQAEQLQQAISFFNSMRGATARAAPGAREGPQQVPPAAGQKRRPNMRTASV